MKRETKREVEKAVMEAIEVYHTHGHNWHLAYVIGKRTATDPASVMWACLCGAFYETEEGMTVGDRMVRP